VRQLSSRRTAPRGKRWAALVAGSAGLWLSCSGAEDGAASGAEVAESTATADALVTGAAVTAAPATAAPATAAPATAAPVTAASCELPNAGYAGECNVCLAARCCASIEACKNDTGCAQQLSCEVQCQYDADPSACTERCFAAGPHGLYGPYDDCSFDDCRASCWS
jgi:hypothetical protein